MARGIRELDWAERIASESDSEDPIVTIQARSGEKGVAGFAVLAAGSLAIHGNLIDRLSNSFDRSPIQDTLELPRSLTGLELRVFALQVLIAKSFHQGSELYQILYQIPNLSPSSVSQSSVSQPSHAGMDREPGEETETVLALRELYQKAGLTYVTQLIRMERTTPSEFDSSTSFDESPGLSSSKLSFAPYTSLPYDDWVSILEQTYRNSADVPELSELRSARSALEGYQRNRATDSESWYVIRVEDQPAGCILLGDSDENTGEITYLGLIPEHRGKGYSSGIMRFVLDWMHKQRLNHIVLAVDCRNLPAVRVYQKWGFQATISYHAWITSPKTFVHFESF